MHLRWSRTKLGGTRCLGCHNPLGCRITQDSDIGSISASRMHTHAFVMHARDPGRWEGTSLKSLVCMRYLSNLLLTSCDSPIFVSHEVNGMGPPLRENPLTTPQNTAQQASAGDSTDFHKPAFGLADFKPTSTVAAAGNAATQAQLLKVQLAEALGSILPRLLPDHLPAVFRDGRLPTIIGRYVMQVFGLVAARQRLRGCCDA